MTIRCTIENHIAEVVMQHPPVNSITVADTWKIRDTFRDLNTNDDVRVIIITGAGRGFCAGADLSSGSGTFDHGTERAQKSEEEYWTKGDGGGRVRRRA